MTQHDLAQTKALKVNNTLASFLIGIAGSNTPGSIISTRAIIIFRPRKWGRKIMICDAFFFANSAKSPLLFTPFSKTIN